MLQRIKAVRFAVSISGQNYRMRSDYRHSLGDSNYFYKVSPANNDDHISADTMKGRTITGKVIDHAVDLNRIRPGESIDVPYEVTVSHSMRDFWQSAFYSHDRINTSTPFARSLGLQDQVVPFHLMLFLAGSMSHAGSIIAIIRFHLSLLLSFSIVHSLQIKRRCKWGSAKRAITGLLSPATRSKSALLF